MKEIYDQNWNDFVNDCTIIGMYQIIYWNFGLRPKYTLLDKTVDYFLKIWLLFKEWAVFSTIYQGMTKKITETIWVPVQVKKQSINWKVFDVYCKKGIYWGLWLRRWNKEYLTRIKKGYLDARDIEYIAYSKQQGFNHHTVYWEWALNEIYWGVYCKMSLEILRYGVKLWVFGSVARSIIPKWRYARYVSKFLRVLKDVPTFKYEGKVSLQQSAFKKAKELRLEYNK